jgi:hypothetical protein
MKCATHKSKESIGYCKKCGTLGCTECLVKVEYRGKVGQQSRPIEVLVCRECLGRIRPELSFQGGSGSSKKKKKGGQIVGKAGGAGRKKVRLAATAAVSAAIVLIVAGAAVMSPRVHVSERLMSPDEVATTALSALSIGDRAGFLTCVDVREFMCQMDSTGVTDRDYREADRERRRELEASHSDLLIRDLFVKANLRRNFKIVEKEIQDESASMSVNPWITCGKKMYKCITLTKHQGAWKISGFSSPDY